MLVVDLDSQLCVLKHENKLLHSKLYSLIADINSFLPEYKEFVGDLAAELPANPLLENSECHENGFYYLEDELKKLRRKLAKTTHPDVCADKSKATRFTLMINEAFEKSDLLAMIKIEALLFNHKSVVEKRAELQAITNTNLAIKAQTDALEQSPEYTLKCRFDYLSSLKNMAIAETRAALRSKIAAKKTAARGSYFRQSNIAI